MSDARAKPAGRRLGSDRRGGTDAEPLRPAVRPWSDEDGPLLQRLLGDTVMMAHLGGPESEEKIRARHLRYREPDADGTRRQFVIVAQPGDESAGWVGYWPRSWRDDAVWEMGWSVVPTLQGRGLATVGARHVVARARAEGTRRFVHAFPSVHNVASNALCACLGFDRGAEVDLEYPAGHAMRCVDWRFDLLRSATAPSARDRRA